MVVKSSSEDDDDDRPHTDAKRTQNPVQEFKRVMFFGQFMS